MFFFVSDLHFGINPVGDASVRRLADKLAREANARDVLLIGGDLAVDDDSVRVCLQLFRGFPGRRFAILGNHDVWVGAGDNSLDRHARLQLLMMDEGFHPLEEQSAIVDGWGLVGALGWYDYSFKDKALGIPDRNYREKRDPATENVIWNDALNVVWNMDDAQATDWQIIRLSERLRELRSAERIIALIHHVPHKDLLVHPRWVVPKRWRFANAFLGSNRFAERLESDSRVKLVVNGHIHMPRSTRRGSVNYHSIGGDYFEKQALTFDGDRVRRLAVP